MQKVFDASAVLAFLYNEPGADNARPGIANGIVNTVNAAEVLAKLVQRGMPVQEANKALVLTGLEITDFTAAEASMSAGILSPQPRGRGFSLGDRACLATALRANLPAVSADRDRAGLTVPGLQLELIR